MATKTTSSSSSTKKTSTPAKLTSGGTYKQGQSVVDSAGRVGTVNYDSKTGAKLSSGQSTTVVGNSGSSGGNDSIVRFDPNTGRALNPGESVINKYTGEKVTEGTKFIAASDLGNKVKDIPVKPVDSTDYMSMLTGITTPVLGATEGMTTETTGSGALDSALANQKNNFTSMMKLLEAPPSMAEAYKQAQKDSGILAKQKAVGDLSAQLNGIQAQAQASQLQVVGQGRGIPEAIIGGQQAQIAKEAAIAALPVSAQLQAAQGNLEMAQQNLDTLFKIKSADLTAQYEYKNNLVKSVYDFATTQEKTKLDFALKQEDRAYQEKITAQEDVKALASMALQNGAPASVLKNISNAKTYKEALTASAGYGQDPLDRAIKNAQLAKLNAPTTPDAPTIKTINGVDMEWNGKEWVMPKTPSSTGVQTIDPKILNTDQFKKAQAAKNLQDTLQKTKEAVEKYGNKESINATGRGVLDTLKVQLRSEISTALEQGVVVPGEAESFDQIAGQLNKSFFIRNNKTLSSLKSLSDSMNSRIETQRSAILNSYGISPEQFNSALGIGSSVDTTDSYLDTIDSAINETNSPYKIYFK